MRFVTGWACTMLVATAEGLPPETVAKVIAEAIDGDVTDLPSRVKVAGQ